MKKSATFALCITLVIICSTSFFKKKERVALNQEEQICLEKFFRYFMLKETAIYTLLGSKPLTVMPLFYQRRPEEEVREEQRDTYLYFLLNRNRQKDREFYNKLSPIEKKEKAYLISEKDFIYDIEHLWDQWEQMQSRFPIKKNFLLVKKEWPLSSWKHIFPECEAIYDVFLVNILKTALVIQENYELFRRTFGTDFDPLEVVFELENAHSKFWDVLNQEEGWNNRILWGLLFGFGRENACCYTWRGRHLKDPSRSEKEKLWAMTIKRRKSCHPIAWNKRNAFTLSHFTIPMFMSFSENDPIVAQYKAEKKSIQRLYKGKDFVTFTLEQLTEPQRQKTQNDTTRKGLKKSPT